MGWSITVTPPAGFPDVQESISSCSKCPGNFYMCVLEMKEKQLRYMERDECISSLKDVIAEIDKGNEGRFSNQYCVDADTMWSKGRETMDEWTKYSVLPENRLAYMPFKTYEEFCGYDIRERMRKDAVRFLLYYVAGYNIEYDW